jgi:hypothetical protein
VEQRRLEAIDQIWKCTTDLTQCKTISSVVVQALSSPMPEAAIMKMKPIITGLMEKMPEDTLKHTYERATLQRPFLTPLAWTCYSILSLMLSLSWGRATATFSGLADPAGGLNIDEIRDSLLRLALPSRSDFINTEPLLSLYTLIDDLETALLRELLAMVDGRELDQENLRLTAATLVDARTVLDRTGAQRSTR